jgi:hypothetical protein
MFINFTPRKENSMLRNNKVELYFPSVRGNGDSIFTEQANKWFDKAVAVFVNLFGGCTVIPGAGYFMSNEHGKVIKEDVRVIYAYATASEIREGMYQLRRFASRLRVCMAQECVAIVLNGNMEFINQ